MIDITIHIVFFDADHETEYADHKHKSGQIVSIYNLIQDEHTKSNRLAFLNVTDVPVDSIDDLLFLYETVLDEGGDILHKSQWVIDMDLLTVNETDELTADRCTGIDWGRLKEVCVKSETDINLTDGDI